VSTLREARKALDRGSADAALVDLWNELEPARLAGDAAALKGIEQLAARIVRDGDEGARREAERLLEAVREVHDDGLAPATAQLEADVSRGGEPVGQELEQQPEAEKSRGTRLGPLIWLLIFLAVVLLNALEGLGR
jgi:hypothetical protein